METQKLFPEQPLTTEEQKSLQRETAQLATDVSNSKVLPPPKFVVGTFGFMPLPVPSLSIRDISEVISVSYANHPVWFLRSEIRSAQSHETLSEAQGRNLYLARISYSLALLGFLHAEYFVWTSN